MRRLGKEMPAGLADQKFYFDLDSDGVINDAANNTNEMIRQTGVFLRESGGVGTVQHVDLAV